MKPLSTQVWHFCSRPNISNHSIQQLKRRRRDTLTPHAKHRLPTSNLKMEALYSQSTIEALPHLSHHTPHCGEISPPPSLIRQLKTAILESIICLRASQDIFSMIPGVVDLADSLCILLKRFSTFNLNDPSTADIVSYESLTNYRMQLAKFYVMVESGVIDMMEEYGLFDEACRLQMEVDWLRVR